MQQPGPLVRVRHSNPVIFGDDISVNCENGLGVDLQPSNLSAQTGSCHKRQKPQAPIRNRQMRKVANAKVRIG